MARIRPITRVSQVSASGSRLDRETLLEVFEAVDRSTAVFHGPTRHMFRVTPAHTSRVEENAVDEMFALGHERRRDTSPHREAAHLKGWSGHDDRETGCAAGQSALLFRPVRQDPGLVT